MNQRKSENWDYQNSAELYGIRQWGGGNFDLSSAGEATVKVKFPTGNVEVSLAGIAAGAKARGEQRYCWSLNSDPDACRRQTLLAKVTFI